MISNQAPRWPAWCAAAACLAGLSASVQAQSQTGFYGVADVSLRHVTNQVGKSGSTLLSPGGLQGSRIGFRGVEDLGGGTKAQFVLESGYHIDTGSHDQQGQLFGRQAWLGISDPVWGSISAGRLYGIPFTLLGNFDPLWIGNFLESSYMPRIVGARYDNSVAYSWTRGGFIVDLLHSFGEQAAGSKIGATTAASVQYGFASARVGAMVQRSRDARERELTIVGGGANYKIAAASLYLLYVNAKRDAGFTPSAGPGLPLATSTLFGNNNTASGPGTQTARRTDSYASAGVGYQFTPAILATLGMAIDNVANAAGNASGKIRTAYLVTNYAFSRRTDVYLALDRNLLGGASRTDPNNPPASFGGQSSRTGVAIGLRTRF